MKKSDQNFAKTNLSGSDFLIHEVKKAFTKVIILWHFELKRYIQIKKNTLDFMIGKILS